METVEKQLKKRNKSLPFGMFGDIKQFEDIVKCWETFVIIGNSRVSPLLRP